MPQSNMAFKMAGLPCSIRALRTHVGLLAGMYTVVISKMVQVVEFLAADGTSVAPDRPL